MHPKVSIVVPIYNEEENIEELFCRLIAAMEQTGHSFEILFINDRSRDQSLPMLIDLNARDPRVKAVSFSRNFGHQHAITAGMELASGDHIVLMDGDLQDPPEFVPELIAKQIEGEWDVVFAVRKKRKEPLLLRGLYWLFYRMLKGMSYIDVQVDAGDFCVMNRRVVDQIKLIPERNRFVRGLRSWVGFRQIGLEYERAARHAGTAKYTMRALVRLALDGFIGFSFVPLRISMACGIGLSAVSLFYGTYLLIQRMTGSFDNLSGWTTLAVSILFIGGVQMIMLGIIGEYIGRMYEEMKGRPHYIVDQLIGFETEAKTGDSE